MDSKEVVSVAPVVKPSIPQLFGAHKNISAVLAQWEKTLEGDCAVGFRHARGLLEHVTTQWRDEAQASAELLAWCQSHSLLKVVSRKLPIALLGGPAGFGEEGLEAMIHDIKVSPKRGRSDDFVYETKPDIRERVPRGLTMVEYYTTSGPSTQRLGVYTVIRGLKKFTGGMGDEDEEDYGKKEDEAEEDATWMKFFSKPLTEVVDVVSTEKANGESAHLSVRYLPAMDKFLLFAGSKNVHLAFRTEEDLDCEEYDEVRYGTAKKIARAALRNLNGMSEENRRQWLTFLASTQVTAIYEFLQPQYQHVELFDFNDPKLQFITFTPSCVMALPGLDKGANVLFSLKLTKLLGVFTVESKAVSIKEVDSLMEEIRQQYDKEGSVLYFLDKEGHTVGLLKKKTVWYIAVRAIREKVRAMCARFKRIEAEAESGGDPFAATRRKKKKKPSRGKKKGAQEAVHPVAVTHEMVMQAKKEALADYQKRIHKRMSQIRSWLGLMESVTDAFSDLGTKFCEYIFNVREAAQLVEEKAGEQEGKEDGQEARSTTPITEVGPRLRKGLRKLAIDDAAGRITTAHGSAAVDLVAQALFPVFWKQFLKDKGLSDVVHVSFSRAPRSVAAMAAGAAEAPSQQQAPLEATSSSPRRGGGEVG